MKVRIKLWVWAVGTVAACVEPKADVRTRELKAYHAAVL